MKKNLLLLCLCLFCGCVEQIDLYENYQHEGKIVFEGVLTNEKPPYYFRLTKSAAFSSPDVTGITDALIIITDGQGVRDTLESLDHHWEEPLGLYRTTRITGHEGETYQLQIFHEDHVYEAKEQMPVMTRIDSVWFAPKWLVGKEETVLCPFVRFQNRKEEENFYLFTYTNYFDDDYHLGELAGFMMRIWPYSILKDTHLPELVDNFNLNDGEAPFGTEEGLFFHLSERDTCAILLYSMTSSSYSFYEDLIKQMRYDGGAFTPSPTSAKGNISNGALGLFRVCAVDRVKALPSW